MEDLLRGGGERDALQEQRHEEARRDQAEILETLTVARRKARGALAELAAVAKALDKLLEKL